MKSKKIVTVTVGAFLSLGLLLTGCNNGDDNNSNNGSSVSDAGGASDAGEAETSKDASGVSDTVNEYYGLLISQSATSLENAGEVEDIIREVSGDETYEAFSSTSDPFTVFDDLNDEQAKELADRLQELNPVAPVFDYSDMSDRDRAVLNLLNIVSSVMLNAAAEQEVSITVPEESVEISGNKATVSYDDMVIVINGEEQPMQDVLGTSVLDLTFVDGGWKIDGQKSYEAIYASAEATEDGSSASDDGE